jgi:hypothetical protein
MASLENRVNALETRDDAWVLVRRCPSCGKVVRADEANALPPVCELGQAHIEPPPPGPGDIVIRSNRYEP